MGRRVLGGWAGPRGGWAGARGGRVGAGVGRAGWGRVDGQVVE